MSLPETKDWKVLDCRPGKTEPNPHGGEFQKFYVDFEGSDDTYWRRNAGDHPETGKTYYGTISEGNYGPMFKKEKKPDGGYTGSSETSTKSSGEYQRPKTPQDQAEIRRQHSQQVAIELCREIGVFEPHHVESAETELRKWADFFDADAIAAGQKASSGVDGNDQGVKENPIDLTAAEMDFTGARTEEPKPPTSLNFDKSELADDSHQWIESLLVVAGAGSAARELALYAVNKLRPDQLKTLEGELNDPEQSRKVEGLKRVEASYEKAEGHPVPVAPVAEDDIPF